MTVRLLAVVHHEYKQRLEVFVEDKTSRKRRVEISWLAKDAEAAPLNWFELVEKEIDFQDAEALAKKKGRVLV